MMQTGILKKIDILVEMAESTANVDTSKAEIKEIDYEIDDAKEELIGLRESKENGKYFKVSEKQVDENIKVSLEAKIKKQEKAIRKLQKEIDSVVAQEALLHDQTNHLKEEITLNKEYIAEIQKRIETMKDISTKEYYQNVLESEKEKGASLEIQLQETEKKQEEKLENINYLNTGMEDLQSKLEEDKVRLAEVNACLENPNSYIDEELKEQDEKRMQELQKHITDLEKRRLEIITDPAMIAQEAKDLLIHDERNNALSKIQELVTIVKSKPYMDIPSSNELTAMLQEEEESATSARDEFASLIDTKNYSSGDTEVIQERIAYLNNTIASLEEKIKAATAEITDLDQVKFKDLAAHLENTIAIYNQLEEELGEYKVIIETENEDKTPKRRAILAAAYERKQKELEDVAAIISHYKENQKGLVEKAYKLEHETIKEYEIEIDAYRQEIREMEYLLENVSKAKDVLAIENDKQKLKDLDAAVKNIKHRQKYNQTPSEIYDEIEISIGTMDVKDTLYHEEPTSIKEEEVEEPIVNTEEVMDELPSDIEDSTTNEETIENPTVEEETKNEENSFVIGSYEEPTDVEEPKEEN